MTDEQVVFCTECGGKLESGSKICPTCGKPVGVYTKEKRKFPTIPLVLAVLGVMVFLGIIASNNYSPNQATTSEWKTLTSIEGKFSVSMPGDSKREDSSQKITDNISLPVTQYIVSEGAKNAYIAQYVKYPDNNDFSNSKSSLESIINGTANGAKGTVTSSSYITVNGLPAADAIIKTNDGDIHVRNIISNKTLYSLLYIDADFKSANYSKFIDSFKVTGN